MGRRREGHGATRATAGAWRRSRLPLALTVAVAVLLAGAPVMALAFSTPGPRTRAAAVKRRVKRTSSHRRKRRCPKAKKKARGSKRRPRSCQRRVVRKRRPTAHRAPVVSPAPAPVSTVAAPAVPPSPPTAQTQAPAHVSGSGATLAAIINPHGSSTAYWFEYGPGTGYGARTPTAGAGSGTEPVNVSSVASGLNPLSEYHYRVVATNCGGCQAGTVYGADETFTTGGYQNPVAASSAVPDPFVLDVGGQHNNFWAFSTGDLFPTLHSTDLVHWTSVGTAMTARPSWVVPTGDWHPWGPSVIETAGPCPGTASSPCFVMYYVGFSQEYRGNCVAVATSPTPGGPYTDQGPISDGTLDAIGRPLGCGDNQGHGMIDPSPFVDPDTGQAYLYASEDYACPAASSSCTSSNSTLQPTISVIPLADDFLSASGPRIPLFSGESGTWESAGIATPTVEGPTMVVHNGLYYLLYSGGNYQGAYGMGYATASSPTGPFTKSPTNPILVGTRSVFSPGGGDTPVTGPNGGLWMVYHGREGSLSAQRTLFIDPFSWRASSSGTPVPVIGGPTDTPQSLEP